MIKVTPQIAPNIPPSKRSSPLIGVERTIFIIQSDRKLPIMITPIKMITEDVTCAKRGEVIKCFSHVATGAWKCAMAIETIIHKHKFKEIRVNPFQMP